MHSTGTKSSPEILLLLKYKKSSAITDRRPSNQHNAPPWRNIPTKATHHDETKKRAHDPQTARAKENPKPSPCRPRQIQAPGTNSSTKAPRQSRHRAWGPTHRHATKEGTTATNSDWVRPDICVKFAMSRSHSLERFNMPLVPRKDTNFINLAQFCHVMMI